MSKEPVEQIGRIQFEGVEGCKFWVRALGLVDQIEEGVKGLLTRTEHDRVTIPIIAEYEVDKNFSFFCALLITADHLGLLDGAGAVYYASPGNREKAEEHWRQIGNEMLELVQSQRVPGEIVVMEPLKESGRDIED